MTVAFVELLAPGARWLRDSNNASGVRAARRLGHRVLVLTRQRNSDRGSVSDLVDRWIECDTTSGHAVAAALRQHDVDLVISWIDPFAGVAREAAVLLGLDRVIGAAAMQTLRTKAGVRAALDKQGLPNARWFLSDLDRNIGGLPLPPPLVVKPVDGFSSIDTQRVASSAEFDRALATHRRRRTYGGGIHPVGQMICEEDLAGPLVSAEGSIMDGVAEVWGHTDRTMSARPYFVETSVAFSAPPLHPDLDSYVQHICDAIGYLNGPFHCEAILTAVGPVLVEMNARLAGGGIHSAIDLATGGDCAESVLRGYLGLRSGRLHASRAVCIAHHVTERSGTVRGISGRRDARSLTGVHDLICRVRPGETVMVSHSNADRLCSVIAQGACRKQARATAEQALSMVEISIE